ncbi:MAG: imidazolonepropionase, partial [Synergistaceae bacterium]|nr:imidazolonepropionase [Synergistaceae bacterium]
MQNAAELVIKNAGELLTCRDGSPDLIGLVRGGWVAARGGKICALGTKGDVEPMISDSTEV